MIPRVWAPHARTSVALEVDGRRVGMARRESGWWEADVHLPPGTRYRFAIDDGEPVPDPRSRSQPEGVLGPSAVVDESFAWTDDGFRAAPLASGLVYEIHVGCFTDGGTFESAIEHAELEVAANERERRRLGCTVEHADDPVGLDRLGEAAEVLPAQGLERASRACHDLRHVRCIARHEPRALEFRAHGARTAASARSAPRPRARARVPALRNGAASDRPCPD